MLFINGYTTRLWQLLRLAPPPCQPYWGKGLTAAGKCLNDWNWWFINASDSLLSTPEERFDKGYRFAEANSYQLVRHVLVSGNSLKIVAHSQGVAFAEGIAAFLWSEKNIRADLLVALQPHQAARIPQVKDAVRCRVEMTTKGDFVANKRHQTLYYKDVVVKEARVRNFLRYQFKFDRSRNTAYLLYLKGSLPFLHEHTAYRRTWCLWETVKTALMLLEENMPVERQKPASTFEVFPN